MIETNIPGWETWLNKFFIPLVVAAIIVNAGALAVPILEPDGALYATIAKTIVRTGNFIDLMVEGHDWLDKPHFPFWMAALSMKMFGINTFAYKFPALLFWAMGAAYTYKLAIKLYGRTVAQLATLIYLSAAHLVISNNDVRAEPYLTGLVIASVYHLYRASTKEKWFLHLIPAALFAACAIMTKGLFVLVTITGGFIVDWTLSRSYSQFLRPRWWLALMLTVLFTLPELVCLYLQFDLHPEKTVFDRHAVSGLRFFFWDSQFGRFFNTGPIRGQGDVFFYFHTLLWAFLPWSLLLYAAIIQKCKNIRKPGPAGDFIGAGAALLSFAMFSLSKFQLPHYLNLLFPFFAILTAEWLCRIQLKSSKKAVVITQHIIVCILPLLLLVLSAWFQFCEWPFIVVLILLSAAAIIIIFRKGNISRAFGRSYAIALLAYAFVNVILYPAILQYQAGSLAGKSFGQNARPMMLKETPANYSFEFYAPGEVKLISIDSIKKADAGNVFFIPLGYADSLRGKGFATTIVQSFPNFHISQLTGPFINYKTRANTLQTWVLIQLH